ncbi:MAG: hypothetical protein WCL07_01000 [bacterium]
MTDRMRDHSYNSWENTRRETVKEKVSNFFRNLSEVLTNRTRSRPDDYQYSDQYSPKSSRRQSSVGNAAMIAALLASGIGGGYATARGLGWIGDGQANSTGQGVGVGEGPVSVEPTEELKPGEWDLEGQGIADLLGTEGLQMIKNERLGYCETEGKEWCDTMLGENKNFDGVVIWITGIDGADVHGHSDAIMGFVIPADGRPVTKISMPRDMRVPGLAWGDPDNLKPGAILNQMSWIDATNPGRYNTFNIPRILAEATGMPADLVVQGSYTGFIDLISFLYDVGPDGKIPFNVVETLSESERMSKGGAPFDKYFLKMAGEDRVIEPGKYMVTPDIALRLLRERYSGTGDNETRQANQMQFIQDLLVQGILDNPQKAIELIGKSPDFLKGEEEKLAIRMVGMSVPKQFNLDEVWTNSLSSMAAYQRERLKNPMSALEATKGMAQILQQIEKGKPLGTVSPSLVPGSQVRVVANDEAGSVTMKGPGFDDIANNFDLTAADKLTYWDDLRKTIQKRLN